MQNILETKNLTKTFGSFKAVDNLSLSIPKGQIYGFLGLNGAGKTTTIRMLLGLIKPSSGSINICGTSVLPGGIGPWQQIGSLVEIPYSYPELTVKENLKITASMRGIKDNSIIEKAAGDLNLLKYINKKACHLSLGNAQRLGLAKALLHKPEILILDEPSNGLDPAGIVEIRQLLIYLADTKSVTVFVSSHILDEISRFTHKIGIIHEGQLIQEILTSEIHALHKKILTIKTRNNNKAINILKANGYNNFNQNKNTIEVSDNKAVVKPDDIAALLVNNECSPTALWVEEENLEDLFMRIINKKDRANE